MAEQDNNRFVFPEFRGATIAELIGRPLVAIVKANEKMATEQVKLLMKICFWKDGDVYVPVMITMVIRRGVIDPGDDKESVSIRQIETTFQVPLITLIPISSLAVEEVDIEFDMDVHSHYEFNEDLDRDLFGDASLSVTKPIELAGSISYESNKSESEEADESRSASISISVTAGSLPLPLGVITILEAYSKSIYPSDASQERKDDWK